MTLYPHFKHAKLSSSVLRYAYFPKWELHIQSYGSQVCLGIVRMYGSRYSKNQHHHSAQSVVKRAAGDNLCGDKELNAVAGRWKGANLLTTSSAEMVKDHNIGYASGDENYQEIAENAKPKPTTRNP